MIYRIFLSLLVVSILGLPQGLLAREADTVKVALSPKNQPTQKLESGTENIEVLRFDLNAREGQQIVEGLETDSVTINQLELSRVSEHDRDQLLRYKLWVNNRVLSTVSLPDSDTITFKNLSIKLPYDESVEVRILADLLSGDFYGVHYFEIARPEDLVAERNDIREEPVFVEGDFPIAANRIVIGSLNVSPTSECNLREEPVCAADGKTYYNLCLPFQKGIEVLYEGSCDQNQNPEPEFVICPDISEPVCGEDGVTYNNTCLLNRNKTFVSHYGACFPSDFRSAGTYREAVELFDVQKNALLQLRPRITDDSAERLDVVAHLLRAYNFRPTPRETLVKTLNNFLGFTQNLSDRTRLEQEIEALRIGVIEARRDSAREKYELDQIPFIDVDEEAWFLPAVKFAKEKGWVSGYKNEFGEDTGLFGPSDSITKAEITKMTLNMVGAELDTSLSIENGLADSHWARDWIALAESRGLALWSDFPNPEKKATRSEVVRLAFEVFEVTPPTDFAQQLFPDVPPYHLDYHYVQQAKALGLISGYGDGTFQPDEVIARSEVAKVLQQAFDILPNQNPEGSTLLQRLLNRITPEDVVDPNLEYYGKYAVPYESEPFEFQMSVPGLFRFQSFSPREDEIMRFAFSKKELIDESGASFWLKIIADDNPPTVFIRKKIGDQVVMEFPRDKFSKSYFRIEGDLEWLEPMKLLQQSIAYFEVDEANQVPIFEEPDLEEDASPQNTEEEAPEVTEESVNTSNSQDDCEGHLVIDGNGIERCFIDMPDAGKSCEAGNQCQSGFCVAPTDGGVVGSCYAESPLSGCVDTINSGQLSTVCE